MTIIHISRRMGRIDKREKPTARTEEKSTAESTIFKSVLARDRSIANHRRTLACPLYRLISASVPLIIGAGGSTKILEHKFSGEPLVLEYAPQLAILSRAKLVITHAGMNTCMETLKFGKPMVAVPVTNDQPGVGARIEYHACGKTIFLGKMSKSKLKQAVEKVWRNKSYTKKAQFFRVEIRKAGGSPRAADLIEETFARLGPEMPQRRFESEEPQSNPHA